MKIVVTESDIKHIVNGVVKKFLKEVRYIDVSNKTGIGVNKSYNTWENIEELKKHIIDLISDFYKWDIQDVSDMAKTPNQIVFFLKPTDKSNHSFEEILNFLYSNYKYRYKISYKKRNDGLYVGLYVNNDNSNYSPISKHEKIRVFHGTDIKTAIKIAKNGVSGKERISRTYSYENGMNPNGLFVTTNFYQAKEFGYHYDDQVILEFTVDAHDLDTPVWNGQDSYFGALSNPIPFSNKSERITQKIRYQNDATLSPYPYVSQSDNPAMAERLFNNNENQALFFGDLRPNQIKRFWWKEREKDNYIPLSYKQFMAKFSDYTYTNMYDKKTSIEREKLYWPDESWKGPEDFARRLKKYFLANKWGWNDDDERYALELAKKWEGIGYGNEEIDFSTEEEMKRVLFPKQIIDILGQDVYATYFDRFYPEFRTDGNYV